MPATESKEDELTPRKEGILESCPGGAVSQKTTGFTLLELGLTLAGGKENSIPGVCASCESSRDARRSTSNFPDVFCSTECEQEFIHTALASFTLEDCIRLQRRLENLLELAGRIEV
jgi:hypothetical protein